MTVWSIPKQHTVFAVPISASILWKDFTVRDFPGLNTERELSKTWECSPDRWACIETESIYISKNDIWWDAVCSSAYWLTAPNTTGGWWACVAQGSPTLLLGSYCPTEFSSNPNQTYLNQLIKVLEQSCNWSLQEFSMRYLYSVSESLKGKERCWVNLLIFCLDVIALECGIAITYTQNNFPFWPQHTRRTQLFFL